ncbi:MAG: S-layer homology domain-containing protein [Agathobacter sp.]
MDFDKRKQLLAYVNKMKKMICIVIAGSMLLGSCITGEPVKAAEPDGVAVIAETSSESDARELEAAMKLAKSKITIPSEYSQFSYSVNRSDYGDENSYTLNWSNKKETKWMVVEVCDGDIVYYSGNTGKGTSYAPKYSKKQLRKTAEAFAEKVAGEQFKNCTVSSGVEKDIYQGTYIYCYDRIEQNILVKDNTIRISVNYETGEVVEFSADFDKVDFPKSDGAYTKSAAKKAFKNYLHMQLSYRKRYDKKNARAYLAYEPGENGLVIDALTGEPVTEREHFWGKYEDNITAEASDSATGSGQESSILTEAERAKIQKMKKLLSQSQAVDILRKKTELDFENSMLMESANLEKSNTNGKSVYVWDMHFVSEGSGGDRNHVNATIDAKTGSLYHFYSYRSGDGSSVSARYTKEQCQTKLKEFLLKEHPEYADRIVLYEGKGTIYAVDGRDDTEQAVYEVVYLGTHDGIPYFDNSCHGWVDAVSGKITNYGISWDDDTRFEQSEGCMSEDEAMDAYLELCHLKPEYQIFRSQDGNTATKTARLVYTADIRPSILSPFTGKQLTYSGDFYEEKEDDFRYTDISASPYRKYIKKLADLGVGFSGGKFRPNKVITVAEFEQWLRDLDIVYDEIPSGSKGKKKMTRMAAVKRCITILGYKKPAGLKGIYKNVYSDMSRIPRKNRGYAALAKGFGLVDSNTFMPDGAVSRGEAAKMVLRMLKIK